MPHRSVCQPDPVARWLTILRVARAALAVLDLLAVAVALAHGTGSMGNFLSYFTIQSNLAAIVVLAVAALGRPSTRAWAWIRGAATFCMVVTGIVYAVLLAGHDVGVIDPWVNTVLHQVMPAALLLDWVLLGPAVRTPRRTLWWLALPLVFFAYSLVRGPLADFYPYPFLDPRLPGGYLRVAAYAAVLAVMMAAVALAVGAVGDRFPGDPDARPAVGSVRR